MDERMQAIKKFHEIYNQARKKYGLVHRARFGMGYEYGIIEVWELEGYRKGKRVVCAKQKDETECYKQAAWELEYYIRNREEKQHGKAVMAV